jgi:hypothetical protein
MYDDCNHSKMSLVILRVHHAKYMLNLKALYAMRRTHPPASGRGFVRPAAEQALGTVKAQKSKSVCANIADLPFKDSATSCHIDVHASVLLINSLSDIRISCYR